MNTQPDPACNDVPTVTGTSQNDQDEVRVAGRLLSDWEDLFSYIGEDVMFGQFRGFIIDGERDTMTYSIAR